MNTNDTKARWNDYVQSEIDAVQPLLETAGYTLDDEQPHVMGERYVIRAVTTASGDKVVLLGTDSATGERVVIKVSADEEGKKELEHERRSKELLLKLHFAYDVFVTPRELFFRQFGKRLVAVYEYIEQEKQFVDRPTSEQFTYALCAFKAQEGAHATTHRHTKLIRNVFETRNASGYLAEYKQFKETIVTFDLQAEPLLEEVYALLLDKREIIDRYGSFLTHTDFVPHNFRIKDGVIYLLDYSSLRFGNKYEGWARFMNFMTLYNPELEQALTQYVADNRSSGEQCSLKLMRLYRLSEIVAFYVGTLEKASGSLKDLNTARVYFWLDVLRAVLDDTPLSDKVRERYIELRDSLRSEDEKKRQQGLH
ncbi:hypothetical protein COU15_01415 [Candidatus Kaiserbacteria bacterium CG10_big_fil_rev_8_21_14_0_10_45_20]|uniref:Aminoglycoside phosphotransferase domain-containing protein n=1 Tax=Candidatus Kaiserbacteria bacterium CG10_big_fil_rev_8_21_14_0_10_45_20 TaxID=1974607 RepID=A0A2H0UG13_9BACT|nr:MAG: hypothetical protein COU15_01415 [Candidatus Kaiserbacteria bacterium CG10_big_fil_rev_8_21_14_0_10_45_20]